MEQERQMTETERGARRCVKMTYKPVFTDGGQEYGTLYLNKHIVAGGVGRADALAITDRYNRCIPNRRKHAGIQPLNCNRRGGLQPLRV